MRQPLSKRRSTTELQQPDGQIVWDFTDRGNLARQLAAIGITDAEVRIVLTIWERGELRDNCSALAISTRALAKRIGLARSWVVEVLDGLEGRGIINVAPGRPKSYLVNWSKLQRVGQSARHQPAGVNDPFAAFETAGNGPVNGPVDGRSDGRSDGPVGRSVGRPNESASSSEFPSPEGRREGWIERTNEFIQSLSQSILQREITLPLEIWTCNDATVVGLLREWWKENRPEAWVLSNSDAVELLGAILAARNRQATDPCNYVATCLRNGVRDFWRAKAKQRFDARAAYAPH